MQSVFHEVQPDVLLSIRRNVSWSVDFSGVEPLAVPGAAVYDRENGPRR